MIELIGWIGGFSLAICGAPQAYKVWDEQDADGVSWLFLIFWLVGEICLIVYTLFLVGWNWPLMLNYGSNLIFITVILYYKLLTPIDWEVI